MALLVFTAAAKLYQIINDPFAELHSGFPLWLLWLLWFSVGFELWIVWFGFSLEDSRERNGTQRCVPFVLHPNKEKVSDKEKVSGAKK